MGTLAAKRVVPTVRKLTQYGEIYIKEYTSVLTLVVGPLDYFQLCNYERSHQSLGYQVPADVHYAVKIPIL